MPDELFDDLPEPRPFFEDGSQFGVSRAAFETMDEDEQREFMRDWFFQNFEDPVNSLPHDDETKEYIFLWGGPYDAKEQLWDKFGEVVSEELGRVVNYWKTARKTSRRLGIGRKTSLPEPEIM